MKSVMGKHGSPTQVLDCSGSICPEPVLKTRKAIASLTAGDIIEVLATDPLAEIDLTVFCEHAGHQVVHSETLDGTVRVRIRVSPGPRPGGG